MRVTKYEHACLVLEKDNRRLVIDPGSFTTALVGISRVVGIVITHEHADHWTPEQLKRLVDQNPDVQIFAPESVLDQAKDFEVISVRDGDHHEVGPFDLKFFGELHAVIHSSIPVVANVGVLVDDTLFYPGDAFTVPPVAVDTLAVPSSGPWLKIGEAMDYVLDVKPKRAFGVHDMVLSASAKEMYFGRLEAMTEQVGGSYTRLEPGDSIEL